MSNVMNCGICGEEVQPLDAHMGRIINGELDVYHIDCWNKHLELKRFEETNGICNKKIPLDCSE